MPDLRIRNVDPEAARLLRDMATSTGEQQSHLLLRLLREEAARQQTSPGSDPSNSDSPERTKDSVATMAPAVATADDSAIASPESPVATETPTEPTEPRPYQRMTVTPEMFEEARRKYEEECAAEEQRKQAEKERRQRLDPTDGVVLTRRPEGAPPEEARLLDPRIDELLPYWDPARYR